LYTGLQVFELIRAMPFINRMAQLAPADGQSSFVLGALVHPIFLIFSGGILPLYGSYRLGLVIHAMKKGDKTVPSASTAAGASAV
jgi:hypothetical protein